MLVCSEDDRQVLGYDNVRVLRKSVDLPLKPPAEREDPYRLLFPGKMDYQANIDAAVHFCRSILPRIHKTEPRAHVCIVGREPTGEIQALHTGSDVFVTGTMPDTAPCFDGVGIVITPIRFGGGTRLKILEAFAHRKPAVLTTIGCEGLAVKSGVHLYRADNSEDFAASWLAPMGDAPMRRTFGMPGRDLAERQYSHEAFQRAVRRSVSEVVGSL
jgi:glycosyltransferase involved in cell wall biosynthesis